MTFKKITQAVLIVCGVLMLGACAAPGSAGAKSGGAYGSGSGAESSGAGMGSEYGSNEMTSEQMLAKRTYYFDFDSDVVREEDKPAINANAQRLAGNPDARAVLEGNTDPRGSREYNVGLGERRAKSVARMLNAKGVASSQVRIVSYGAERLASNGTTEEDYAQDRRVNLVRDK